jgi:hypothetical protein
MDFREDLKAYVDGELSPEQVIAIQSAADSDPKLAAEIDRLRAMSMAVSGVKREYEPTGLEATLSALRHADLEAQPPATFRWKAYALGFAAAAAVVGLFAFLPTLRSQEDRSDKSLAVMKSIKAFPGDSTGRDAAGEPANASAGLSKPLKPGEAAPMSTGIQGTPAAPRSKTPAETITELQQRNAQLEHELAAAKSLARQPAPMGGKGLPVENLPMIDVPKLPAVGAQARDFSAGGFGNGDNSHEVDSSGAFKVTPLLTEEQVAKFSATIRQLAHKSGGKIVFVGGTILHRILRISVEKKQASQLSAQIRTLLKANGSVLQTDAPAPSSDSQNPLIADKLKVLKADRDRLLEQYLPEAPQVKELDDEIKKLEEPTTPPPAPKPSTLDVSIG